MNATHRRWFLAALSLLVPLALKIGWSRLGQGPFVRPLSSFTRAGLDLRSLERSVDQDITHAFETVRDHLITKARRRDRRALRRLRPPSVRRLNIGHTSRYHGRHGITIAIDDARRGLADQPYDLNDGLAFPFSGSHTDGRLAQYANALFHENVHYIVDRLTGGVANGRQAQEGIACTISYELLMKAGQRTGRPEFEHLVAKNLIEEVLVYNRVTGEHLAFDDIILPFAFSPEVRDVVDRNLRSQEMVRRFAAMDIDEQVPYALGIVKMLRILARVPPVRFLDVIRKPFRGGDDMDAYLRSLLDGEGSG